MTWEYPFFSAEEMSCKCGHCTGLPKRELMERLVDIRKEFKRPMVVSSGYRCPDYNAKVASTGRDGPHTRGLAADILCWGAQAHRLIELAIKHGMTGIGVAQKGDLQSRYVHLDCIEPGAFNGTYPRPTVWTY